MKLTSATFLILLVLFLTAPYESDVGSFISWFSAVAAKLGVRLVENAYYARYNTRNVPPGISCPGDVFGMGMSRSEAQNSAKAYASLVGDSLCAAYARNCQIFRFSEQRGK